MSSEGTFMGDHPDKGKTLYDANGQPVRTPMTATQRALVEALEDTRTEMHPGDIGLYFDWGWVLYGVMAVEPALARAEQEAKHE